MDGTVRQRRFDLLAVVAIFIAYTVTTGLARRLDLGGALLGGAANTVPVVIFGAVARRVIVRRLVGQPVAVQFAGHVVLCAGFSFLTYWVLILLLGLAYGGASGDFVVRPFSPSGAAWQSLENVTTYALIAMASYLQAKSFALPASVSSRLAQNSRPPEPDVAPAPELSRYFIRSGEDFRPVDLDKIICICGADDYAEVTTLGGKHLARLTLAEFVKALDSASFVRVHRSWIVNVDRIARAEPAGGGRLLLHMETGQMIPTSRAGARVLRGRVL